MITGAKLRAIVNLLADPLQAHAAANILAKEAAERKVLVADLIAEGLDLAEEPLAEPESLTKPEGKVLNDESYGLQSLITAATEKAWLVDSPNGGETWLPRSQCQSHGLDAYGRTILIVPMWLARKKGFV
jgi:hypothetical protein